MESQQLTMTGSDFEDLVQQANQILADAVPQDGESLAAVLAEHMSAPVRATLVGAADGLGMLVRLTQAADGALLVAQPVRDVEGRTVPDGSVQLSYAPSPSWRELAELLPPVAALRAPAVQGQHADGRVVVLPDPAGGEVEASLHLRVEAWVPGVETPKVWARAWVVRDGELFDLRHRDGGLVAVQRPAGSVAAELEWALAGAVDVIAGALAKPAQ